MKKQIISILTAVSLLSGSGIVSNAICDDNEYISVGIKSMPKVMIARTSRHNAFGLD